MNCKHDHLVLLQEQEVADHNTTGTAGHLEQPTDRQPECEHRKPKQRRLFLESETGEEAEQRQAAPNARHAPDAGQQPTTQRQGKATKPDQGVKAQNQQPSKARKRPEERLQDISLADDDEDVPSTYNNMPSRPQQQPRHDGYADENAAPEKEHFHPAAQKAWKPKSQKRQQKKEMTAQVTSAELDFDASDDESDEYEPTQAKAAAKRAGQKALQPKSPRGTAWHPQQGKQQGKARQPGKTGKHPAEEGQAKRPRGRPRKAVPQQEQQPKQARKRKAVTAGQDPNEEEGGKAVAKPKKQNVTMLKATAMPPDMDDSEGQTLQVWLAC